MVGDIARVARELGRTPSKKEYLERGKFSDSQINLAFSSWTMGLRAAGFTPVVELKPGPPEEKREPKILFFDLETAPMRVLVFGLFDQNVGLNQIEADWHLLSIAAKWRGSSELIYADQRRAKDIKDDRGLLKKLWSLLDEADVVITQNGKAFDEKVANARFIMNGMLPPSPFKHIDTKQLAKKRFRFTSNKLEYLCTALNVEHKKLAHKKFPGMELWTECLKRNAEAWIEMEKYNKADVLALEAVYEKLAPWGVGVDLNLFYNDAVFRCHCGSTHLEKRGFNVSAAGKFQRYQCRTCGAWHSAKGATNNLMGEAKKLSLKTPRGCS